ncbi:MAG: MFS transporter [Egibacteraceae bacterium]
MATDGNASKGEGVAAGRTRRFRRWQRADPSLRRALFPLAFGYAAYGGFWGAWAVVLADYLAMRDLSLSAVGGLFAVTSITAIATMAFIGGRAVQVARPPALAAAFLVTAVAGLWVGLATGLLLLPAFALLGVGIGMIDVLVNLVGAELEAAAERPVLQLVHASYGAGGAVAAVLAALATNAGWSPGAVLGGVSAGEALAAVLAVTLLRREAPAQTKAPVPGLAVGVLRHRADLRAVAVIVLCAFFVEGSMDAWSVLFVRADLGGPVLGAALAFAAFASAITVGRLFAARVLFRFGHQRTLVVSAVGSVGAGTLMVSAPTPQVAGLAFLMLGFFLSVAAPAAFGKAGAGADHSAGMAIAAVTTVGYGGFVVGPPIMGWIGDRLGLRAALLVLVLAPLCMLLATVRAGRLDQVSGTASTAAGEPSR